MKLEKENMWTKALIFFASLKKFDVVFNAFFDEGKTDTIDDYLKYHGSCWDKGFCSHFFFKMSKCIPFQLDA